MHMHQWVVVPTVPVDPTATASVDMAQRYPMTAICKDPLCGERRILIPAFTIHPGAGPLTPIVPAVNVPREWTPMTRKARAAELARVRDMPTSSL